MKVLFVISSISAGGAERVLNILANYFVEKFDYEVTVATYDIAIEDFYKWNEKVERVNFGVKNGTNIFTKIIKRMGRLWRIRKLVKSVDPDIVISLIIGTNLEVAFATIGNKTPVMVVEHSNYWAIKSRLHRALRIFLYKLSNKVVLLTQKDKLKYDEYLRNCDVIPNPILLEGSRDKEVQRKKTLLAVGRLVKTKQFDHIIFVFSHIVKKHPDWKLVIVGEGRTEVELNLLTDYADQLGVKEYVDFAGSVTDMSRLYKENGIFVSSSCVEGFPMALGEAMLFGMPVVSYDCLTGPSEMIEDQVSGLLIELNNKNDLEREILSLISSEEQRMFLGDNAKKRMQEFSVQKIGEKWKFLIESIVDKSGSK